MTGLALEADDMDFRAYFAEHEAQQQAEKVRPFSDFADEAFKRLDAGVAVFGEPMPWLKTHNQFRFRSGELTIWAGVNGQGKSLVMGQVATWLDSPTVIASLEMKPDATVARLMRQATTLAHPTRRYFDSVMQSLQGKLYVYDHVGTVTTEAMLGLCHYAAHERGIKHVMIDSLVKCGMAPDDYSGQARFIDKLAEAAKEHNIHVHLVHHVRKGKDETETPDKFSIKGAGEITDLADNVLLVSRNQVKEKIKRKLSPGESLPKDQDDKPDSFIRVVKQRNGEWEGNWCFWWDEKSTQWLEHKTSKPMAYAKDWRASDNEEGY